MHEGHRERMRERLLSADESLTDCELLEILLYDSIDRKNTNPIAHRLLDSFIDLQHISYGTPRLLCMVAGIGRTRQSASGCAAGFLRASERCPAAGG